MMDVAVGSGSLKANKNKMQVVFVSPQTFHCCLCLLLQKKIKNKKTCKFDLKF